MNRTIHIIALILIAAACAAGQTVRLKGLRLEPVKIRPNLADNYSFEEGQPGGIPAGWQWDARNTDALCRLDTVGTHSGRQSLNLTNRTPFGAHIYGMLWRTAPVPLKPGQPYTLSAYVKSSDSGTAWIGGGSGWQFRLAFPNTGGKWRRVWLPFTPGEAERDFVLRIITESPTAGIRIDDIKLEEGAEPSPVMPAVAGEAPKLQLAPAQPLAEVQGDRAFEIPFLLYVPRQIKNAVVEARLNRPRQAVRHSFSVGPGAWRLLMSAEAVGAGDAPHRFAVRLLDGNRALARAETSVRFYSETNARQRLERLRQMLPAFKRRLDQSAAKGQDTAYPMVSYAVLENFIGYAREDLDYQGRGGESQVKRALMQIGDMERMAARLRSELDGALSGKRALPPVPRWTGRQRPRIEGPSFIGPAVLPGGSPVERAIFFTGYGHFIQVRSDMEKFPGYGVNIIQIELGPSAVFPREGEVNEKPIREIRELLDRAARAGVAVNLLISPHYMPGWMLEKYPHLRKRQAGFLQYCLHAPEGEAMLKRFIALLIPQLRDRPALHSICLSNEPVSLEEPCEYAVALWRRGLEARYGDIDALNARLGSRYEGFAEVPLPDPYNLPAGMQDSPLWAEFVRFNQEFFAGWHRMLADAVHEAAPGLPVHAKAMTWTFLNDGDVRYGVDAYLFGGFSQINGNDSANYYAGGPSDFAQGWQMNAMGHDLQRSILDAPVFNSENHLIPDRSTDYVPGEHVRSVLWQAAVHGQSATTIWVWERTFDPRSDFAGSIMHRPACAEAVGRTNHDLNRFAEEVAALQKAAPDALLLQSASAAVWDEGAYTDCLGKLYVALSFAGLKIGFVTERQLEDGLIPRAALLIVPNIRHLSESAFRTLQSYRGRLVLAGEGNLLTHDEYNRPRTGRIFGERLRFVYGKTAWKPLWESLQAAFGDWNVQPEFRILNAQGQPEWGVEWRSASIQGGKAVNLSNYRNVPLQVLLTRNGKPAQGVDLLTGERVTGRLSLKPLQVRLVRVPSETD
ncbi:MAG: beta-galactosidase [Armatimonadetes bacterium]|nr:beta-galactosidase [Armatimonadota bacterium]